MKRLCSIMVCALLILTACNCKKDYTGSIPEEFDAYCTSAFNNWKIPGMSVVVVKDGKVVTLKASDMPRWRIAPERQRVWTLPIQSL